MLLATRTSVARCSRKLAGRKDRLWEERKVLRQEITVMALAAIGLKAPMQIFRCSRNGKKLRVQQLLLLHVPPLLPSGVLEKEAPAAVELALGITREKGTCSKKKVDSRVSN